MTIGEMLVSAVSEYTTDRLVSEIVSAKPRHESCSCDYTGSRFYRDHGCCEWCYFVGEDTE